MWRRISPLCVSAVSVAVLWAALQLAPASGGLGTHRALGLPPCAFLAATGIPCPSCGLTTAFAALAKGDLAAAARANPVGILLFLLTVFLVPAGVWCAVRRITIRQVFFHRWFDRTALALVGLWLGSWMLRLSMTS